MSGPFSFFSRFFRRFFSGGARLLGFSAGGGSQYRKETVGARKVQAASGAEETRKRVQRIVRTWYEKEDARRALDLAAALSIDAMTPSRPALFAVSSADDETSAVPFFLIQRVTDAEGLDPDLWEELPEADAPMVQLSGFFGMFESLAQGPDDFTAPEDKKSRLFSLSFAGEGPGADEVRIQAFNRTTDESFAPMGTARCSAVSSAALRSIAALCAESGRPAGKCVGQHIVRCAVRLEEGRSPALCRKSHKSPTDSVG